MYHSPYNRYSITVRVERVVDRFVRCNGIFTTRNYINDVLQNIETKTLCIRRLATTNMQLNRVIGKAEWSSNPRDGNRTQNDQDEDDPGNNGEIGSSKTWERWEYKTEND